MLDTSKKTFIFYIDLHCITAEQMFRKKLIDAYPFVLSLVGVHLSRTILVSIFLYVFLYLQCPKKWSGWFNQHILALTNPNKSNQCQFPLFADECPPYFPGTRSQPQLQAAPSIHHLKLRPFTKVIQKFSDWLVSDCFTILTLLTSVMFVGWYVDPEDPSLLWTYHSYWT